MNRKRIVISMVVTVIFAISAFIYLSNTSQTELSEARVAERDPALAAPDLAQPMDDGSSESSIVIDVASRDLKTHGGDIEHPESIEPEPISDDLLLVEAASEIIAWQNDRGYTFADEDSDEALAVDYDSYENDALEELSINGDRRAALLLGRRLMQEDSQDSRNKAAAHLFEASARGYTASLIYIGAIVTIEALVAKSRGNVDEAIEHVINAKAWYKVAVLRGDPLAQNPMKNIDYLFRSDEIALVDEALVDEAAKRIYKDLTARRADLDLPEFENDYPPALDLLMGID